jgi:ketosteroid isomerase-like protein
VSLIERLHTAMNAHDLDAMLECFDPAYHSTFPAQPSRAFRGREQVRKNWSHIFDTVPDYRSDLLRHTRDGDVAWTEWHWHGTQRDGTRVEFRGVVIFQLRNARIAAARLYVEPVEKGGEDIDAAVETMMKSGRRESG